MTLAKPLIAYASNSAWNLAHFRAPLIDALSAAGVLQAAIVPAGSDLDLLRSKNLRIENVVLDRSGTSPLADFRSFLGYWRSLRRLRPRAVLCFTAKPNIYASLAANLTGVPVINNISGLGTGFIGGGRVARVMSGLYRLALRRSAVVFFQNEDDRDLFLKRRLIRADQARLLPGSGVDLERFKSTPMPQRGPRLRFLLVARMLRDKGVCEFVEAARMLRREGLDADFHLLGAAGDDNPSAIDPHQLERCTEEGSVRWLGEADDVRPFMADADVIVLPSYREGLPRTLLEAAAVGRPVVASDVPGCRQAVRVGETGLLCTPRSSASLAQAMRTMVMMEPAQRAQMGAANRSRAVAEFSHERVVSAYLDALAACGVTLTR